MAVQYRSISALRKGDTGTIILAKPAGVVEGDMLIAFISMNANKLITPPAGWINIYNPGHAYNNAQSGLYKVAGPAEPASYTFTLSGATPNRSRIIAFYSDDSIPLLMTGYSRQGTSGKATPAIIPSVTFANDNSLLAGAVTFQDEIITSSWGVMTQIFDDPWNGYSMDGAYQLIALSGATGNRNITLSAADYWTTLGVKIEETLVGYVFPYNVDFESPAADDSIHAFGIVSEGAANDDSVHISDVSLE